MVGLTNSLHFFLFLDKAQASQHMSDGHLRVIGPKYPEVLVLVIMVAHLIAVDFLEPFPVLQG